MEALSQGYKQLERRRRLLQKNESIAYWFQLLLDMFLVTTLLLVLVYLRERSIGEHYRFLAVIAPLLLLVIYRSRGLYRRANSLLMGCWQLLTSWSVFLSILVLLGFLTKTSDYYSRVIFLSWAVLGFVLQCFFYVVINKFIGFMHNRFSPVMRSVVVGNGRLGCHLAAKVNHNQWLPDQVIGFISCYDFQIYEDTPIQTACLGYLEDIARVIVEYDVRRVYIAVPLAMSDRIEGLHKELLELNVDLIWVPDIYALHLLNHSVREISGLPLIYLNESPLTSTRTGIFFKEFMDRAVALLLILLLSPLLMTIAALIKLTSRGPIIFKQERHGWDGKVFKVWKFRSMYVHDEQQGHVTQAVKNDRRVTSIGRFIRRTSIDELPQLFNVLFGSMSLVGPRPHAVAHNDHYGERIGNYLARHRIKPGITGLAQIKGYRGETETDEKMHKRAEYDMEYINTWSLWLDIKILIKTPFSLFSKDIY